MPLLNTIGIAGLAWYVSFITLCKFFGREDNDRDVEIAALFALIPAVFAALAIL